MGPGPTGSLPGMPAGWHDAAQKVRRVRLGPATMPAGPPGVGGRLQPTGSLPEMPAGRHHAVQKVTWVLLGPAAIPARPPGGQGVPRWPNGPPQGCPGGGRRADKRGGSGAGGPAGPAGAQGVPCVGSRDTSSFLGLRRGCRRDHKAQGGGQEPPSTGPPSVAVAQWGHWAAAGGQRSGTGDEGHPWAPLGVVQWPPGATGRLLRCAQDAVRMWETLLWVREGRGPFLWSPRPCEACSDGLLGLRGTSQGCLGVG